MTGWKRVIIIFVFLLVLVGAVSFLLVRSATRPGRIAEGVRLESSSIGGLGILEVRERLDDAVRLPLWLVHGSQRWRVVPREWGLSVDVKETLQKALTVGHSGSVWRRALDGLRARRNGVMIPVRIEDQSLRQFAGRIQDFVERPARDAKIGLNSDGTLSVTPEQEGVEVDVTTLKNRLHQVLLQQDERVLEIPTRTVPPSLTTALLQEHGITRVLGSSTTRFDPENENRVSNICRAAKRIDGTLLKPGAVFSLNRIVGPRLAETGFKEAPVILNGELVPGIGGGVSQVASTTFDAALVGNMEILERHNHSIPISYIPLGRDATVWNETLDLKFKNSGEHPVLVAAKVGEDSLTMAILGSESDRVRVDIETELIRSVPPEEVTVPGEDTAAGAETILQPGRPTRDIDTYRIVTRPDGSTTRQWVVRSHYKGAERIVLSGTE